jgi:hypothetical protein
MQNYLKSTLKNFQNPLFLDIPNGFVFLDQTNWRKQKKSKNNTKSRRVGTRTFDVLKTE